MCDCCDDYYCGGCSGKDSAGDYLYGITPYVSANSSPAGTQIGTPYVTLDEAKQHCRVDIDDDDALIQAYLDAALEYVSESTGLSLITMKHTVLYNTMPVGTTPLVPPFKNFVNYTDPTFTSIAYKDASGAVQTLTLGANFGVLTGVNPTPFVPVAGGSWPTDYQYSDEVGYVNLTYYTSPVGAYFSVGSQLKVVVLMLTAHWYTAREPVTTGLNATNNKVPYTIDVLLSQNTEITF